MQGQTKSCKKKLEFHHFITVEDKYLSLYLLCFDTIEILHGNTCDP